MSTPANAVNASPSPDAAPANGKRRRLLLIVGTLFLLVAVVWLLLWILVFSSRESTDDAYVAGDQVAVVAQTSGIVTEVAADDTGRVDAGQVVVKLDPADAQADLERAGAALIGALRQARQQRASATQLDAVVLSQQAELARAEADLAQREPLLASRAIAGEELRHAQTAVAVARANLAAARRSAEAAHVALDGRDFAHQPAVLQARAAYLQAWLARQRTNILAPIGGQVAQRSAQIGARVQPGQSLMDIVALDKLWVDANFKEAQLADLRIGQPVRITTDLYGSGFRFHGHIVGMAAGTGSAFALLPAQNASGNWIKVTQRVPVRIALDPAELKSHPLRIGLSVTAVADIKDQSGAVLATTPDANAAATTAVFSGESAAAAAAADALIQGELGTAR
ncbi:MAG TPA: HlyD family efflux transporter periplasmic adaptor subunit [Steroidobacteraceae bacterium]|nr:HlyD family efflux transporter periplasmic adaptor subunit [Steroidobacteraceae bacterium]